MDDPFATLGLPRRFDLDEAELHRRFIAQSAATHPDRFTDPLDQADAAEKAAAVNEAYRVLKDPESRAGALLALLGVPGDDKALPPDLLMEMMELREEMEDAIATGDAATLDRLRATAQAERAARLDAVRDAFAAIDAGRDPATHAQTARTQLNALRYFRRMLEQMPQ